MSDIFNALAHAVGTYQGEGTNHEGEAFIGDFCLAPLLSGRGFQIHFSAKGARNPSLIFHEESSVIAANANGGISLYNLNSNIPFLCEHVLVSEPGNATNGSLAFRYGQIDNRNSFREEIRLDLGANGSIGYHYSWGMPGGEFTYRSGLRANLISGISVPYTKFNLTPPESRP